MAPASGRDQIQRDRIAHFAVGKHWIKAWGLGRANSSSVCILTAAFVEPKSAHGNSDKHRSISCCERVTVFSRDQGLCRHRRKLCRARKTDQRQRQNVRPYAPSLAVRLHRPTSTFGHGLTQSHAIQLRWLCPRHASIWRRLLAIRHPKRRNVMDAKLFTATETCGREYSPP